MAYTATVTKQAISKVRGTVYSASITMVVSDEVGEVFTATASGQYNSSEPDLARLKDELISSLASQWDKYASENNLFTAAAFDTIVGQIQSAANAYIN